MSISPARPDNLKHISTEVVRTSGTELGTSFKVPVIPEALRFNMTQKVLSLSYLSDDSEDSNDISYIELSEQFGPTDITSKGYCVYCEEENVRCFESLSLNSHPICKSCSAQSLDHRYINCGNCKELFSREEVIKTENSYECPSCKFDDKTRCLEVSPLIDLMNEKEFKINVACEQLKICSKLIDNPELYTQIRNELLDPTITYNIFENVCEEIDLIFETCISTTS